MDTVFARCEQAMFANVKIVKLALSERHEEIGITMGRCRPVRSPLPNRSV
jgi:7,8-dihydroneopterin aldolase/epimerase/oxygenase